MTKAQETLKKDIEKIKDDNMIEKIQIFIMGILAQQSISEQHNTPRISIYQKERAIYSESGFQNYQE